MALHVCGGRGMHTYTALCFLLMPVCVYVASMRDMLSNASVGTPSLSRLPSQCHGAVACLNYETGCREDIAGDVHP